MMFNLNAEEGTPEAARQRKILLGGLAGVALLVILAAVFVLPGFFGGGSDATAVAIPHHTVKPSATSLTAATPAPTTSPTPAAAPDVASARDPFAKLPQELVASTASGSTGTAATSTTDAGSTSTATATASPAPSTSGTANASSTSTTASGTPGTTTSSVVAGKPVQYMSFAGAGSAKIEIDSTDYTVKAGQTVAGYSIVSVTSGSISVSHGSVTKTLALGELQTF
jgi:hypothetical protein